MAIDPFEKTGWHGIGLAQVEKLAFESALSGLKIIRFTLILSDVGENSTSFISMAIIGSMMCW